MRSGEIRASASRLESRKERGRLRCAETQPSSVFLTTEERSLRFAWRNANAVSISIHFSPVTSTVRTRRSAASSLTASENPFCAKTQPF